MVDRLGVESFDLFSLDGIGPVGIAYAARHPERASNLILFATWTRSSDYLSLAPLQGMLDLMDKDWQMFTENAAHSFLGWPECEERWVTTPT